MSKTKTMALAEMLHRNWQGHIAAFTRAGKQTNEGLLFDAGTLAGLLKTMTVPFDDLSMDSKAVYYFQAHYIMDELGLDRDEEE